MPTNLRRIPARGECRVRALRIGRRTSRTSPGAVPIRRTRERSAPGCGPSFWRS
jgi:hypothetical protein